MSELRIRVAIPADEWVTSNDRLHWREPHPEHESLSSDHVSKCNRNSPEECANIPRGLTTSLDPCKEWL